MILTHIPVITLNAGYAPLPSPIGPIKDPPLLAGYSLPMLILATTITELPVLSPLLPVCLPAWLELSAIHILRNFGKLRRGVPTAI